MAKSIYLRKMGRNWATTEAGPTSFLCALIAKLKKKIQPPPPNLQRLSITTLPQRRRKSCLLTTSTLHYWLTHPTGLYKQNNDDCLRSPSCCCGVLFCRFVFVVKNTRGTPGKDKKWPTEKSEESLLQQGSKQASKSFVVCVAVVAEFQERGSCGCLWLLYLAKI